MGLRRIKDLSHYTIEAIDTDIGSFYDFYFDDHHWIIRYIVVATGTILSGRKVLISPIALLHPAWSPMHIRVNLTWKQVESGPSINLHKPISRQHEAKHHEHFGLPKYWEGDRIWGSYQSPKELAGAPRTTSKTKEVDASTETHPVSYTHLDVYKRQRAVRRRRLSSDKILPEEWWPRRRSLLPGQRTSRNRKSA